MSDSILPIEVEEKKVEMEIKDIDTEGGDADDIVDEKETQPSDVEEEIKEEVVSKPKINQEDIFVKEEKPKGRKKRKPMSDEQKAKLAKAREKSLARRKELKEAKQLEAAKKRIERKQKVDAKVAKRMEDDAMLEMKAKLLQEAQSKATWDEERLVKLMTRTIDSYIETQKKQKPTPRQYIPAPNQYPQYAPQHVPQNNNYYAQPQPPQQQQPKQPSRQNNAYNSLFGFGGV